MISSMVLFFNRGRVEVGPVVVEARLPVVLVVPAAAVVVLLVVVLEVVAFAGLVSPAKKLPAGPAVAVVLPPAVVVAAVVVAGLVVAAPKRPLVVVEDEVAGAVVVVVEGVVDPNKPPEAGAVEVVVASLLAPNRLPEAAVVVEVAGAEVEGVAPNRPPVAGFTASAGLLVLAPKRPEVAGAVVVVVDVVAGVVEAPPNRLPLLVAGFAPKRVDPEVAVVAGVVLDAVSAGLAPKRPEVVPEVLVSAGFAPKRDGVVPEVGAGVVVVGVLEAPPPKRLPEAGWVAPKREGAALEASAAGGAPAGVVDPSPNEVLAGVV